MHDHKIPGDSKDTPLETSDNSKPLSDAGKLSIQGQDVNDNGTPDAPPEHQPSAATGELGDARRAETDAEKSEVKHHHLTEEDKEGSIRPPEGWRPGVMERS